jgi:peptidoglycan/LPS O-acetylase OafA/YrhL
MPQLDGLRALAVMTVLYTHYLSQEYWLFDIYWGGMGVRLFFVLSGFLITGILLREKEKLDSSHPNKSNLIRQFYLRRFLRLAPVLLVVLVAAVILDIPKTRETFWWHVFYLSNFNFAINNSWQGSVAHLWTLAVEEQFYLIWPLLVLFLSVKSLLRFIYWTIPTVIFYRIFARAAGIDDIAIWVMLPDSMDALCLGALLAILVRYHDLKSSQQLPIIFAGIGFFAWVFGQIYDLPDVLSMAEFTKTTIAVYFAWLVLRASEGHQGWVGRFLELQPLVYIGKISYGIYILHTFVKNRISAIDVLDLTSPGWIAAISSVTTVALAALAWHSFEKPINKFRRNLTYRHS